METRVQDKNAGEQQFGAAHGAGGSGASAAIGGTTSAAGGEQENVRVREYAFGDPARAEIDQQFTYHPPRPDQIPRYNAIREKARELAELYITSTPPSREQSLAITDLRRSAFWANASIAVNEL